MNNGNNNIPQGVITSSTLNPQQNNSNNNNVQPQTKKKLSIKVPQMDKKKIVLLVLLLFVGFIVFCFVSSGKGKTLFNKNKEAEEYKVVEVDVDTEWGKEYGKIAQELYKEKEINRFDMAFINLDDLREPEMIVKYLDAEEKEFIRIYHIDDRNGKAKVSKDFGKADIKLLFSLVDGKSDFYLNIRNENKYGTYTLVSKIVAGTVVAPDIQATNEKQLNAFTEDFVVADYAIIYYEVKKDNFLENFKTMYGRYEKYSEELANTKLELFQKYNESVKKKVDEKPYLVTGSYHLTYGDYDFVPQMNVDGSYIESKYSGTTIVLKNDGTLSIGGVPYKYSINGNVLTLDNGFTIKVNEDDHFILSDEGGSLFVCKNPYVMPEEDDDGNKKETNNDKDSEGKEEKVNYDVD